MKGYSRNQEPAPPIPPASNSLSMVLSLHFHPHFILIFAIDHHPREWGFKSLYDSRTPKNAPGTGPWAPHAAG